MKIIKAQYGQFFPSGIVIATEVLQKLISNNHLQATINNNLLGDPFFGVVKELRVNYTVGGKLRHATVKENQQLNIPAKGDVGTFKLISAFYGHFPYDFNETVPDKPLDVTQNVQSNIEANRLIFSVNQDLVGATTNPNKKLRLTFSTKDGTQTLDIATGHQINLSQHDAESKISVQDGGFIWITPNAGRIECTNGLGETKKATVETLPAPIQIEGDWNVTFPTQTAGTLTATWPKLVSWTENSDNNIKYFSGTATYEKEIDLAQEYLEKNLSIELQLGQVDVIAEVIVNGKNLGILWKSPFNMDISKVAQAGKNQLQIKVTNLWANRLIGDEQYPEDVERNGVVAKTWPKWLINSEKRDSKRTTFTAWRKWDAKGELQTSGILGPVIIRPYAHVKME